MFMKVGTVTKCSGIKMSPIEMLWSRKITQHEMICGNMDNKNTVQSMYRISAQDVQDIRDTYTKGHPYFSTGKMLLSMQIHTQIIPMPACGRCCSFIMPTSLPAYWQIRPLRLTSRLWKSAWRPPQCCAITRLPAGFEGDHHFHVTNHRLFCRQFPQVEN